MKPEMKKLIIANLPYLLFVYLFGKLGQAYRLAEGIDLSQKLLHFADGCAAAFESAAPSFHPTDLLIGVAGAAALRLMVYCKGKNAKKYRKGVEYGSARWGGPKDIAPYIDPNFDNNILLTQTERLTMNNRPKDPKTARNKNVLVIGGSGSGKTRFFVKPNLMQCVSKDYPTSFVITDPKGSLIGEVGQLLIRSGYRVKVLNTINFSKSMKYNPFRYLHSEKDVLKLVNTLICNTKGEGEKSAEDFWVKSERLFYTALIGYIWQEAPEEEMNFTTLLEMINASEAREDDPEFQSPVDLMFERLEERDPDHFAVRQYKKFLLSAGKTRSSILISAGARMAPFDIREVRELMEDDELELDTIGDEKTALFLIMSDTDTTFNFILAMVQSQLINLLCDRADDKYGGRLPVHVRMILDEFANIGQIPNFDKLIATIRSREISASIILQSQSQLKAIYKDAAEIISDNCDCTLFLSGRGKNAKEISDVLGKETIDSYNQSENRGAQTSHGLNYQKLGKELMIMVLNLFGIVVATCMIYNMEFKGSAVKKMYMLPISVPAMYLCKFLILTVMFLVAIVLQNLALAQIGMTDLPDGAFEMGTLVRFAGYSFLTSMPVLSFMLLIFSRFENMWVPLGIGVAGFLSGMALANSGLTLLLVHPFVIILKPAVAMSAQPDPTVALVALAETLLFLGVGLWLAKYRRYE